MPKFGPIKRRDLIAFLRQLGFDGPFPGGKHDYMQRGQNRVRIPNPHRGDISLDLLREILSQAKISNQEWESL
mgnify:CR=1 FL=1